MRNRPIPAIDPEDAAFVRALVVQEDDALIVFNKPSGLAVQTRGNRGPCLENLMPVFARSNGKIPRLVHRLDAGTSGLIVAAKTKPAAARLSEQFSKRLARKTYLALAHGVLPEGNAGTIDQALLKCDSERGMPPMVPSNSDKAQSASTHWRVLGRAGDTALFELRPKTGRMHQLRVHLAHLGCPILGDPHYGAGKESAARLMLHAAALWMTHPDGSALELAAPMPEEMEACAVKLGLSVPHT